MYTISQTKRWLITSVIPANWDKILNNGRRKTFKVFKDDNQRRMIYKIKRNLDDINLYLNTLLTWKLNNIQGPHFDLFPIHTSNIAQECCIENSVMYAFFLFLSYLFNYFLVSKLFCVWKPKNCQKSWAWSTAPTWGWGPGLGINRLI